jgi:hypothetical protein
MNNDNRVAHETAVSMKSPQFHFCVMVLHEAMWVLWETNSSSARARAPLPQTVQAPHIITNY